MSEDMVRHPETYLFGKDLCLAGEMIVTGREIGADRHFYYTLAHNSQLFAKVVQLVKSAEPRKWTTIGKVLELMGENRFIAPKQVSDAYKVERPKEAPIVPYSEETLRECARQNRRNKAIWYLHWFSGRSLVDQFSAQNSAGLSHLKAEELWWISENEQIWSNFRPAPGFYLVDFKCERSVNTDLDSRLELMTRRILSRGEQFIVAHEAIVNEAMLMIRELDILEPSMEDCFFCVQPGPGKPYCLVRNGRGPRVLKEEYAMLGTLAAILKPEYIPTV